MNNRIPLYKKVKYPLTVPVGKKCWDGTLDGAICEYFSYLGTPHCGFGLGTPQYNDKYGALKTEACLLLEEDTNE